MHERRVIHLFFYNFHNTFVGKRLKMTFANEYLERMWGVITSGGTPGNGKRLYNTCGEAFIHTRVRTTH